MQAQKAVLRRHYRQRREALEGSLRTAHDRAILVRLQGLPELLAARSVFCYVSTGGEVDTRSLLGWLLQSGKQLAVPGITPDGRMLAYRIERLDELEPGPYGIPAPRLNTPRAGQIDVCITPGVAFTPGGARLGLGQGYYDRWFTEHAPGFRLAPAYECQLADELPTDGHDINVDAIVTERRIIRVS